MSRIVDRSISEVNLDVINGVNIETSQEKEDDAVSEDMVSSEVQKVTNKIDHIEEQQSNFRSVKVNFGNLCCNNYSSVF